MGLLMAITGRLDEAEQEYDAHSRWIRCMRMREATSRRLLARQGRHDRAVARARGSWSPTIPRMSSR